MIANVNDIKPTPFEVWQVRNFVKGGADLKFNLKKLGISETAYNEGVKYIQSHWKEYCKYLDDHADELHL